MCEVLLSLPVVIWISGPLRKKKTLEKRNIPVLPE